MEKRKRICPRMSGVMPRGVGEGMGSRLVEVRCKMDECVLWDTMLGCCGDRSLVEQERRGLRHVIEKIVEGFEASLEDGDKKRLEAESEVEHLREMGEEIHPAVEEMGKRRGQVAVLTEVLDVIRTRFRI